MMISNKIISIRYSSRVDTEHLDACMSRSAHETREVNGAMFDTISMATASSMDISLMWATFPRV